MDYQYFPTGEQTAALMWAKFKRPIGHVCDPSAGKGNLIRYAQEGFAGLSEEEIPWVAELDNDEFKQGNYRIRFRDQARYKFSKMRDMSAVEIDTQHHASLKDLGAKLVGYDFLQVQSLATVDQIIMNPPFAEGAKHVLHAWDAVYDAEIVAIVNAETVRNPYSQERKRLVELIEKHGSVEFLRDQFNGDVERKTDVEIALIYLEKIPAMGLNMDFILGGMRADQEGPELNPEQSAALALPGNFVQDTCTRFDMAVKAARAACEAQAIANHLSSQLGITLDEMQAKGVGNDSRESLGSIRENANKAFKESYENLKKQAWAQIIRSTLLTDKLSNQARRKVESSASSIYEMEFSPYNVHGFLTGVLESMGDIYRDMICDLFDTIIERSSDNVVFFKSWKSNQKHRIGVRIRKTRFIIPNFRTYFGGGLDYESEQFLADIDKVFGYLHGETEKYDGLVEGFRRREKGSSDRIKTRYFDFRYYSGTGTIHFYPASQEVVEKINQFVGKLRNWIPADMNEANADFKKQYEQGEALSKEYLEAYRKSATSSYGFDDPARALMRDLKGKSSDGTPELDRLQAALDQVHAKHKLHCGPALEQEPDLKALMAPAKALEVADKSPIEPEQLDLLAA